MEKRLEKPAALFQAYVDSDGSIYPCCITAGDTRDAPQSTSLGNIRDDWERTWRNINAFSRVPYERLHDICKTSCVKRLSEINSICDKTVWDRDTFF